MRLSAKIGKDDKKLRFILKGVTTVETKTEMYTIGLQLKYYSIL